MSTVDRGELVALAIDHAAIAERLHALEARSATIVNLLGVNGKAARLIAQHFARRRGPTGKEALRGRAPEAIGPIMLPFRQHLEASMFLNVFQTVWHVDAQRFRLETFVCTYELHAAALQRLAVKPDLQLEHALLVADLAVRGKVQMGRCDTCTSRYLQTQEPTNLGDVLTRGECPYCRQLASVTGTGGGRLRINPTSQRRFLRLLGTAPGKRRVATV